MHPSLQRVVGFVRRRAENVVAALLGIMFVAFIVQIVFRYFLNFPVGWTSEVSVICWLYMVLLGSAVWLKESEEIRFDLVAGLLGKRGRHTIGAIIAAAAVVLFAMSLPATYKYVTFMKVESTSYLKIRLDLLYFVYVIFVVAVIARYLWALWCHVRGRDPEKPASPTEVVSGL
jgi:TRAP-type C4-dicarboxylate transport system permease small subunit